MPKCNICREDNAKTVSPCACGYVICEDCASYGVNGAVLPDRQQGVKCINCKNALSDTALEAYFQFSGEQEFRNLQGQSVSASSTTVHSVSTKARVMNAWAMCFHCPACATPNGFAGEGCDVITCSLCKKKFNPVTGEQTHTFLLEELHRMLEKVREKETSNQVSWALSRHAKAATACCFPELLEAIKSGEQVEASSHIASYAPQFSGFAEHILALGSRPPPRPRSPTRPLSPVISKPTSSQAQPSQPTLSSPTQSSASVTTSIGVIPASPASWTCAFCNTVTTGRIKCPQCGKTKFESQIKK